MASIPRMNEYFQESFEVWRFIIIASYFSLQVFCIDLCDEINSMEFARVNAYVLFNEEANLSLSSSNETSLSVFLSRAKKVVGPTRLDVIRAALRIFVQTKQRMNANHEFGLCVLTEGAIWVIIIIMSFTIMIIIDLNNWNSMD